MTQSKYPRGPLTDRINAEPSIINGMSATEGAYIGLAAFCIGFALGFVIFLLTGFWPLILILSIFFPMVFLWYGSIYLQKLKRGKPEGTYTQALRMYFAKTGLIKSRYLTHDGYFELGRRL